MKLFEKDLLNKLADFHAEIDELTRKRANFPPKTYGDFSYEHRVKYDLLNAAIDAVNEEYRLFIRDAVHDRYIIDAAEREAQIARPVTA